MKATAARLALATLAASAATLAALAVSTLDRWTAESTDRAVAEVCHWLHTGNGPLTVAALHGSPRDLEARAWRAWSARLAADHAARSTARAEEAVKAARLAANPSRP